ncbi:Thiamine-phosphate synthase [Oceanobacillus picturae]|uniref:Thiamine-phosphate synthase n=1 Tax=Oceanobacillus picturae TaxID=171693 RepID=W9AMR6_9BACI|nr:thiamine phosphate synthase [Oceanobacillus picturae]RIU91941.1 thiamine phosphate synthase [Oceanobacillus picturae]CDO03946.1 Thiamine-phosphate synthase [Oceanobacillus picturae]
MEAQLLRKYFIMGSQDCERNPVDILTEAAQAGVTAFQFREKGPGSLIGLKKVMLGRQLRKICYQHSIPFIVNDDLELAEVLDADGIHVGQDDVNAEEVRARFPDKMIGLSISTLAELEQSPLSVIDYLGAGPIFPTGTKKDAKTPVGTKWISQVRKQLPHLPLVGIGGITTISARDVMEAGADGVAVISAITKASDIQKAVNQL